MCGIIASLLVDPANYEQLIEHRGVRTTVDGPILHRRLPIVGVGAEHDQPLQRGEWTIAFVGEVLNFKELRPHEECDADIVADTWRDEGPNGFRKFDGFWSVVAHNSYSNQLHILVDYLNQKPMYYRADTLSVASEPLAAAAMGPTTRDEIYYGAVLKWGYCPETDRTPWNEVKKTRPGEHIVLNTLGRTITDPLRPMRSNATQLKDEIERAIRRRVLSSDVPVACLLSGGLDSSIVYTVARRYADVRPYYVATGDADEERKVQMIARSAKVVKTDYSDVNASDGLLYMQEPLDLGSLEPQIALSCVVRERVCLTGDGADEMFGGYGRATKYDSQYSDIFYELVNWHLPRLDRVMMRHQIEVRSPFLSRRVVQMALGLPKPLRTGKQILKDIFADDLPDEIIRQKKKPLRPIDWDQNKRSAIMVRLFKEQKYA